MTRIKGLIAATFTPVNNDYSLKEGIIPKYAQALIDSGIAGAFIGGSSGESLLFTLEERKLISRTWAPYSNQNFKVIVHVGSTNYQDSRKLAVDAYDLGLFAVAIMAPVFFQPANMDELIDYCALIASTVPDMPFYYYHFPDKSGLDYPMQNFLKEGKKKIPNLAGIKFTHTNLIDYQLCMDNGNEKFDMFYGKDETLLCGLSLGAVSAVGTTYNFMPGLYNNLIKAFKEGDMETARKFQMQSVKVISIMNKYKGAIVAGKAILALCGIDCGPCRPPIGDLKESEINNMKVELDDLGFFDF